MKLHSAKTLLMLTIFLVLTAYATPLLAQDRYFTDFRDYTTGNQPSDWTHRWATSSIDFSVAEDASTRGGKFLEMTGTNTDRTILSWDKVDNAQDVQIVTRHRFTNVSGQIDYLFTRASGTSGNENNYAVIYLDGTIYLTVRENGGVTVIDSAGFTMQGGNWYWSRLTTRGNEISLTVWADGDDPSQGVSLTGTDGTHTSGWAGVGNLNDRNTDFDWVGVGINGETAPMPPAEININTPGDNYDTNVSSITVGGTTDYVVAQNHEVSLTVNGVSVGNSTVGSDRQWSFGNVSLNQGGNEIVARVHDGDANQNVLESDTITVTLTDTVISFTDPQDGESTSNSTIDVSGFVDGPFNAGDSVVLTVDGAAEPAVTVQSDSSWTVSGVGLTDGENQLVATLHDGSTADPVTNEDTITVVRSDYAIPSGNTQYEWINRVQAKGIDNTSGDDGGYGDYTNLQTTFVQDNSVDITVEVESTDEYQEHGSVWVDWDENVNFESDERTDLGSCTTPAGGGTCTLNGTIQVPRDAELGTTRMRVMNQFDGDGQAEDPDNPDLAGEAEDYTINVEEPPPRVAFSSPDDGSDTNLSSITAGGTVNFVVPEGNAVSVSVNGASEGSATIQGNSTWTVSGVNLSSGSNELVVQLHDGDTGAPVLSSDTITVNKVNTAVVTIDNPNDGSATDQSSIDVSGSVSGPAAVGDSLVVTVNGSDEPAVSLQSDSSWQVSSVGLSGGDNEIVASLYDGSTAQALVNQDTITVTQQDYATPSGDDQYEWINRVQAVRGPPALRIDNTSGGDGGYADYTNLSATVLRGGTMQVSVQADAGDAYTEHVSLWVDWDRNISFESDERVYFGSCTTTCTLMQNVDIPADAKLTETRMRVIQKYDAEPTNPTETGFFG